jgi:hypothetical protein
MEAFHETARGRIGGLNCRITDLNKPMPCSLQEVNNPSHAVFWNQDVVGVVGRDSEDRDAVLGERLNEREQHSGLLESKRPFELQADPVVRRVNVRREIVGRADDGEFVCAAADRCEFAFRCLGRDGSVGREAGDGVGAVKAAEFELVTGIRRIARFVCERHVGALQFSETHLPCIMYKIRPLCLAIFTTATPPTQSVVIPPLPSEQ